MSKLSKAVLEALGMTLIPSVSSEFMVMFTFTFISSCCWSSSVFVGHLTSVHVLQEVKKY